MQPQNTLQLPLLKGQGLVLLKTQLVYLSCHRSLSDYPLHLGPNSLLKTFKRLTRQPSDYVLLFNRNDTVEYFGAIGKQGGVYCLDHKVFHGLYVRQQNLLASSVETFGLPEKALQRVSGTYILLEDSNATTYLQAHPGLTEKNLGLDESIHFRSSCLVGYSQETRLSVSKVSGFSCAKGPGRVLIDNQQLQEKERRRHLPLVYNLMLALAFIFLGAFFIAMEVLLTRLGL